MPHHVANIIFTGHTGTPISRIYFNISYSEHLLPTQLFDLSKIIPPHNSLYGSTRALFTEMLEMQRRLRLVVVGG